MKSLLKVESIISSLVNYSSASGCMCLICNSWHHGEGRTQFSTFFLFSFSTNVLVMLAVCMLIMLELRALCHMHCSRSLESYVNFEKSNLSGLRSPCWGPPFVWEEMNPCFLHSAILHCLKHRVDHYKKCWCQHPQVIYLHWENTQLVIEFNII